MQRYQESSWHRGADWNLSNSFQRASACNQRRTFSKVQNGVWTQEKYKIERLKLDWLELLVRKQIVSG